MIFIYKAMDIKQNKYTEYLEYLKNFKTRPEMIAFSFKFSPTGFVFGTTILIGLLLLKEIKYPKLKLWILILIPFLSFVLSHFFLFSYLLIIEGRKLVVKNIKKRILLLSIISYIISIILIILSCVIKKHRKLIIIICLSLSFILLIINILFPHLRFFLSKEEYNNITRDKNKV